MQAVRLRLAKQNGRVISSYWKDEKSNFTRSPSASLAVCGHKHSWKSLQMQQYFPPPEAPFSYILVNYAKVGEMRARRSWRKQDSALRSDLLLNFYFLIVRYNRGMFSFPAMLWRFFLIQREKQTGRITAHTPNQLLSLLGGSLLTNSKYHSDKL